MTLSQSIRDAVTGRDGLVEGQVVLGTLPAVSAHLLARCLADLIASYPALQLSIVYGLVAELVEALRAGRVDLVVLVGEVDAGGLVVETLRRTRLVAAMARSIAPRRKGKIANRELRERRFLAWDGPPDPTFAAVDRFVRHARLRDAFTPRVPHIETLRALARAGAGYAILPAYTVDRDEHLITLEPSGLSDRAPISLITRGPRATGRTLREVAGAVRNALAEESQTSSRPSS